ncbi:MAG: HEAT repeat domain-containing protein [Acidobacteriota bacterium]
MRVDRLSRVAGVAAVGLVVALADIACKSVPQPSPVLTAPFVASADRKLGWILRLEQQRTLRDPDVPPRAVEAAAPPAGRLAAAAAADLEQLALDPAPSIRLRAVIAIGRVGMADGVPLLQSALQDAEPAVRQAAAFGLGLLGRADAAGTLEIALTDPDPMVRARAAEALGLIGAASSAPAITKAAAGCPALLAPIDPDDQQFQKPGEIELCRLSLYALVRLRNYEALASIALDAQGQPVSRWWPVAYALQRIGDPRAAPALLALAATPGVTTAGFALRGLAALKSPSVAALAPSIAARSDVDIKVRIAAIRAIAQVGGRADVPLLIGLVNDTAPGSPLGLEAMAALGALKQPESFDTVVDALTDRSPALRAAAMAAAARINPDGFLLMLSGLGADKDWTVRAALASVLATLPADRVTPALVELAGDEDARVHGPALEALAAVKAPQLREKLTASLTAPDFAERGTAARLFGDAKFDGGVPLLVAAYARGDSDAAYGARLAALEALAKYGDADAVTTLRKGLADREWPVRQRAAQLLTTLGQPDAQPVRPAPLRQEAASFESAALLHPPFSPHAFIETRYGVIEIQLDVVDAPFTSQAFITQARSGFFNGIRAHRVVPAFVIQAGDPRGDGEGGPGYTLRDELSAQPYVRGTVGMALDGPETGGSQWFITLSPQPHLDAKYTVFGRVVNGGDVLDQVKPWDVIERVRIWDGVELR